MTHIVRRAPILPLVALFVQLIAAPANASSIVFSNLGPGDTYQASVGWSVGMPPSNLNYQVAASFVPSANVTLDQILAPFADAGPPFGGPPSTIDLSIRAANGSGLPGAVLESFLYSGPIGPLGAATLITFTSNLHPLLLANSAYWIVAIDPQGPQGGVLGWSFNSTGDDSTTFGVTLQGAVGGFANADVRNPDVAFAVLGTPASGAAPVPEPATLTLTALGLAAATIRRRRAHN